MERKHIFHFISGLPRTGSTLLANILLQNPRFHATHTSGVAELLFVVRNKWDTYIEFKAHPDDEAKPRVLGGILENFYETIDRPVVFDKGRAWTSLIEMLTTALGRPPKILVPVRDVRDILASFEKLWRENSAVRQLEDERNQYFQFQTVEGRLATWMSPGGPVGLAYNRVRDAVIRGHRDHLHFIPFEELTSAPEETMRSIYTFLEEPYFDHDFDNVEQVTHEDDRVHGMDGLHDIRQTVAPIAPRWPELLGQAADDYANLNFWEKL